MVILLTPLNQSALEISLSLSELVNLDVVNKNLVYKQSIDKVIALVKVNCTHHSLESITVDVFLRDVI